MTDIQKILALEAALTACGSLIPLETKGPIRRVIDHALCPYNETDFGVFIDDQKEACLALAVWASEGGV